MKPYTLLDLIALTLALIHFGVSLAYYAYLKTRWLRRPWGLRVDPGYTPTVTVIVPTYNEADLIQRKLDDIHKQEYPRDRLEVIVVDSASTDGTPEAVRAWASKHPEVRLKLITEPMRRGKVHALNLALKHATGEVIIITDADALWPRRDTLQRVASYFADPRVGAVSCIKLPEEAGKASFEECYRSFYNAVRVAESKIHSTPIFHGELAAFRKNLLEKLGGFDPDIGADDSHTATRIALMGYRAIIPEDIVAKELIPKRGWLTWRVRRAQHLIQHFTKTLRLLAETRPPKMLRRVILVEAYLHLLNPWLLAATAALLATSTLLHTSLAALALLATGLALLAYQPYRTWILAQLALMIAAIRNLRSREIVWEKQVKTLTSPTSRRPRGETKEAEL